ncbi:hypothetical protein PVT67_06810 [Gallaecimonas kandeliae]|uniref:hypothetical protein n=1 Tax=Gallaecimonas kandeliae TaxID=3029055 RepID=UPI002648DDC8|nr:hypothetical protein [Gallaecimonas kandeliae]WKE66940.1 hypothetical protein PVT67_06810 [Gallaecimonas kandeliae]
MATLDKDQVLADFIAAYNAKNGKEPQIEQKGSWYAIDGGKSVRLADIVDMTAELKGGAGEAKATPAKKAAAPKAEPKAAPKKAAAPKAAPAKKAVTQVSAGSGLLPKAFWEDVLEGRDHHCRRPRGF